MVKIKYRSKVKSMFLFVFALVILLNSSCQKEDYAPAPNPVVDLDSQVENYRNFHLLYPSVKVEKSSNPYLLEEALQSLPNKIKLLYGKKTVAEWTKDFVITGLAVSSNNKLVFEEYYRGNNASSQATAFSVTKSIVSALCGIALKDGLIETIDDSIDKYVPEFTDTGYEGVSIKDILQMSSGIRYMEDNDNPDSDGIRFIDAVTSGSLDQYMTSLQNEIEPGTEWNYQNVNTQALCMLLRKITGKNLNQYLQEKIWEPAGMEYNAWFRIDQEGVEFAPGHFTLPLRDRLRFGLLYLNNGSLNGNQILSAQWVKDSHTPDAPYLMPNEQDEKMGYGYQFWTPLKDIGEDDYLAIGVEGQFVYINPSRKVVIAISGAYPDNNNYGIYVYQMLQVFRQIAKHYS